MVPMPCETVICEEYISMLRVRMNEKSILQQCLVWRRRTDCRIIWMSLGCPLETRCWREVQRQQLIACHLTVHCVRLTKSLPPDHCHNPAHNALQFHWFDFPLVNAPQPISCQFTTLPRPSIRERG